MLIYLVLFIFFISRTTSTSFPFSSLTFHMPQFIISLFCPFSAFSSLLLVFLSISSIFSFLSPFSWPYFLPELFLYCPYLALWFFRLTVLCCSLWVLSAPYSISILYYQLWLWKPIFVIFPFSLLLLLLLYFFLVSLFFLRHFVIYVNSVL